METTLTFFIVFALTLVAIVALGRPVRGRLDETGVEIHTYLEKGPKNAPKKNSR